MLTARPLTLASQQAVGSVGSHGTDGNRRRLQQDLGAAANAVGELGLVGRAGPAAFEIQELSEF